MLYAYFLKTLPNNASKKTIHTEHLKVHQSNKSLHGKKGPGSGIHWIPGLGVAIPPGIAVPGIQIFPILSQKSFDVELVVVHIISERFHVSRGP